MINNFAEFAEAYCCDKRFKKIDIEKVSAASETDACNSLRHLRQALTETSAGLGRVRSLEQILMLRAHGKSRLTQVRFKALP